MNKIQALDQAGQLYRELNELICQWDPYGLSQKGEIEDEFSHEAWEILTGLPAVTSVEGASRLVTEVFARAFSREEFTTEVCAPFGKTVWDWWLSKP